MKKIAKLILLISLFAVAGIASAHQPYYVAKAGYTGVSEPEISKAYYGLLPGKPAKFVIATTTPFELYVGLLVPDRPNAGKNISAYIVYQDGTIVAHLDGESFVWTKWHEEFAGDDYWQGPEFRGQMPAGTYTISVSSPHNWDRYVVAIGNRESFPLSSFLVTERQLYSVKTLFFGKPWYSMFEGKIGRYVLSGLIIFILIIIVFALLLWRLSRKSNKIRFLPPQE